MSYPAYPQYTASDVEWVGAIPDGWQELRLKFVGDAIIGLTYDPDDLTDETTGTLVLRANNIQDRRLVADDPVFVDVDAPERLRTKSGDILICSRNGSRHLIGKNAQVTGQFVGCYFGAFNTVFRSPVNDFLFHVFNSSLFEFQSGSYLTSTINQLTLGALNSFVVPLPPVPEQQQIAAFLDWKTGQIDGLIEKKKELLEKLKEKRLAVITQAVTRGLNPAAPLKDSGIPWLGQVPEHWEVKRLRFAVATLEQGWSPQCDNQPADDDCWGVMKVGCVNGDTFDPLENKALPSELEAKEHYELKPRDIIISRANTKDLLGSAAIVPSDVRPKLLLCDKLYRVTTPPEVYEEFLTFFLRTPAARYQYEREATGASNSMQNIGQDTIKNLVMTLPPLDEQKLICQEIRKAVLRLDKLMTATETAIDRLTEYRIALITAATTGKIDVRGVKIPEAGLPTPTPSVS